jgi:hypothetical protein
MNPAGNIDVFTLSAELAEEHLEREDPSVSPILSPGWGGSKRQKSVAFTIVTVIWLCTRPTNSKVIAVKVIVK